MLSLPLPFLLLLLFVLLLFPLLAAMVVFRRGGCGRGGGAVCIRGGRGGVLEQLLQLLNPGDETGEKEKKLETRGGEVMQAGTLGVGRIASVCTDAQVVFYYSNGSGCN